MKAELMNFGLEKFVQEEREKNGQTYPCREHLMSNPILFHWSEICIAKGGEKYVLAKQDR